MKKSLAIFAHPYFEYSTVNVELIKIYEDSGKFEFKDLYEEYPSFHIPAFRERKRIRNFDRLIFHFPLIWFGLPPLLKLWIDEVFDTSWFSEEDHPLVKKDAIIIVTTGGKAENYSKEGLYETTVEDLLKQLTLSLKMFNIEVKDIVVLHNSSNLEHAELENISDHIRKKLNT